MFNIGDEVRIICNNPRIEAKKAFIGRKFIIDNITNNTYYDGIQKYSLDGENLFYWREKELELVKNYTTVKTTKTEIAGKEIKLLEINNNKSICIGNEQFNIEQTKELINVLNDLTKE